MKKRFFIMGKDEIDCGSFFDDLLDFPPDDATADGVPADASPTDWSTPPEAAPGGGDSFFSGNSDGSPELSVPYEDIVQLEWLSNFVEDSFSDGGMLMTDKENLPVNNNTCSSSSTFQSCSPVSVLESSSSSAINKHVCVPPDAQAFVRNQTGRARSKRPRPATFSPRPALHLAPIVSPECSAESLPLWVSTLMEPKRKKKKKKLKETVSSPTAVRKCMHCEITKTPQWRAGPMGPKTLCNACGVRYKSGRLFPEYRPAASPTFVAAMHSNSHKKVVEMRVKGSGVAASVEDALLC